MITSSFDGKTRLESRWGRPYYRRHPQKTQCLQFFQEQSKYTSIIINHHVSSRFLDILLTQIFIILIRTFYIIYFKKLEASRGEGAQKCDYKIYWLWFRSPLEGIKYLFTRELKFKARRWVRPLNTQCHQNSSESGERNVLTLGSLCLHCCVRETA